jgi:hypothetical protein
VTAGQWWAEQNPNVALFHLIHSNSMQAASYSAAAAHAVITAGWTPPVRGRDEPHGCRCPCHRPK